MRRDLRSAVVVPSLPRGIRASNISLGEACEE